MNDIIPICVAFDIPDDLIEQCCELNKKLENRSIAFCHNCVPHITLLQFNTKLEHIREIRQIISNENFTLTKIKINNFRTCGEYNSKPIIGLDIEKTDRLINIQNIFYNLLKKFIVNYDGDNYFFGQKIFNTWTNNYVVNIVDGCFQPHITIGIANDQIEINNLSNNLKIKNIEVNKCNLYKLGDFCTCSEIIDFNNVQFIAHRINTVKELLSVKTKYGIELDIRDKDNKLILCHDPFEDGENFENFLKHYNHSFIILNIKSERVEYKVNKLLEKYNIEDYFFLDSSFPMIYNLIKNGERNIAIRFSEYEPFENIKIMEGKIDWIWVDCFSKYPLDKNSYDFIKLHNMKICLVSPELQSHPLHKINDFKMYLIKSNIVPDLICTKYYNIDKWIF